MTASATSAAGRREGGSLADGVYLSLHTAIVHGTYRPNQRLVETELADELGASRTPVREALQRLASEGLTLKSRHGWQVREFTLAEIREIYEVRAALEGYAARLAASRIGPQQIKQLEKIIAEQRKLTRRAQIPRPAVVDLNDRFHDAVIAASGNERLVGMLQSNRMYYFNYQVAALYTEEQTVASLDDHEWLVEALRRHNADKAELLAREHIAVALKLIEGQLS